MINNNILVPTYVGYWYCQHGKVQIGTETKPLLWHRFWFSFFFGIEWYKY
jgi:hypothetical protein